MNTDLIRKIEISEKIPYKYELSELLDFLLKEYPLINHKKLSVKIIMTKRWYSHATCYNWTFSDVWSNNRASGIDMDVTNEPMMESLMALAHEYCHALQNDDKEKSATKIWTKKTTKRKGGAPWETEADIYSVKVLAQYFNKSCQQIVNETGIRFYEKSKVPLFAELDIDQQLVLESPEQKERDEKSKASLDKFIADLKMKRPTTLGMVTVINCPNKETLDFIQFCSNKFIFIFPVKLEFKPKFRYNGCWYLDSKKVVINLNQMMQELLYHTIAHEFRHVEQDMYPLVSSVDLLPRERLLKNAKERDANVTARKWISEYVDFKSFGRCSPDNYEFKLG